MVSVQILLPGSYVQLSRENVCMCHVHRLMLSTSVFAKVDVYLMLSHLPGRHRVGKTLCEGWHSGPGEGRRVIFTVLRAVRNGFLLPAKIVV